MKHLFSLAGLMASLAAAPAIAQETLRIDDLPVVGKPTDGEIGFQPTVTGLSAEIKDLDSMILVIITAITVFVVALMAWVIVRYNRRANPNPSSVTHNTPIEIAWTLGPVLILMFIGAYSLPALYRQQEIPEGEVVIKAIGNQWYWTYDYVDEGFEFDSYMIGAPATLTSEEEDAGAIGYVLDDVTKKKLADAGYSEEDWLLATDTAVVVPVDTTVVVQVTASDVIHSWTVPAFGVKQDGVPGRLAELWFKTDREGVYFGQCSELCGQAHAYMPITVKVVSKERYQQWLDAAKTEYAGIPQPLTVASN